MFSKERNLLLQWLTRLFLFFSAVAPDGHDNILRAGLMSAIILQDALPTCSKEAVYVILGGEVHVEYKCQGKQLLPQESSVIHSNFSSCLAKRKVALRAVQILAEAVQGTATVCYVSISTSASQSLGVSCS